MSFYKYENGTRHGYQRKYKKSLLRKKGFTSKGDAEADLRQAMSDIDASERGEVRCKPTTAQEALDIYRRNNEIRAKDKASQFGHNVRSNCKILQEFVDRFGPNKLIRECTSSDLRAFYQTLCFRMSKNSAAAHSGRVQGMLKAAQGAKADLVNWLRPTLTVSRKTEYERRVVTPVEYAKLVQTLLAPPVAPSRRAERNSLWRDTGDAVQLLRLTGGRLNEVLRIKLDQFSWSKGHVTLYASKTERERNIPLWGAIPDIVQRRIREGLTDGVLLFPRATVATFDNAIARACRKAASAARLDYGQAEGFTCHSLRHTFITDLMTATGNDAGTVMKYSGHKSIESFSVYLHPTDNGRILATQSMATVDPFLILSENAENAQSVENAPTADVKPLRRKQLAG